jgi:predicted RNA methylase
MSKRGPEYVRQKSEKYFTPDWVTSALLDRERFFGSVIDPGAGAGHILDVLTARGITCRGLDIEPDRDDIAQMDFLTLDGIADNIITNPPFGHGGRLGLRFILAALAATESRGGKVAMLLPLTFDAGKTRQHVFGNCPQHVGKYVLTQRIRWANLIQKDAGPMENHCWHVWDWRKNPAVDAFVRYI